MRNQANAHSHTYQKQFNGIVFANLFWACNRKRKKKKKQKRNTTTMTAVKHRQQPAKQQSNNVKAKKTVDRRYKQKNNHFRSESHAQHTHIAPYKITQFQNWKHRKWRICHTFFFFLHCVCGVGQLLLLLLLFLLSGWCVCVWMGFGNANGTK